MNPKMRSLLGGLLAAVLLCLVPVTARAVELKVSRDAVERTMHQQLFSGPMGRFYLKGDAQSPCFVYAENAHLKFVQDRVVVVLDTHAKLGKAFGSSCLGFSVNTTPEVSLAPIGEGETIGFRDARVDKVFDQKEFNFFITPFLSKQLPKSMQVNAAELLRKALAGSTASSGFRVTLDRLRIHSIQLVGDDFVVDADGDISVR